MDVMVTARCIPAREWVAAGNDQRIRPIGAVIDDPATRPAAHQRPVGEGGLGVAAGDKTTERNPRAGPAIDAQDRFGGCQQKCFIDGHVQRAVAPGVVRPEPEMREHHVCGECSGAASARP